MFLAAMITFGSYYSFDMPSTLQMKIEVTLQLTNTEYNLLYSVYSWANLIFVLIGGWMIDRWGVRVCGLIFCGLIFVGNAIFAAGCSLGNARSPSEATVAYALMCLGRALFGCGAASARVVQTAIVAQYFSGKELALAFAVGVAVSRIASIFNFVFTPFLLSIVSSWPFCAWFATLLTLVSFAAAIAFAMLDHQAELQRQRATLAAAAAGPTPTASAGNRTIRFSDIKRFPNAFWALALCTVFFYIGLYGFIANGPNFFNSYHYQGEEPYISSVLAGVPYMVSIPLLPTFGRLIDNHGRQSLAILSGFVVSAATFVLLHLLEVPPVVPMILLGVAYSVETSALWPSAPLLVEKQSVGKAVAVMFAIQMFGLGLCTVIIGQLQDLTGSFFSVLDFLLAMTFVGMLITALLMFLDNKENGPLNKSMAQRQAVPLLPTDDVRSVDAHGAEENEDEEGDEDGRLAHHSARSHQVSPVETSSHSSYGSTRSFRSTDSHSVNQEDDGRLGTTPSQRYGSSVESPYPSSTHRTLTSSNFASTSSAASLVRYRSGRYVSGTVPLLHRLDSVGVVL